MVLRLCLLIVFIPVTIWAQNETVGLLYSNGQESEGYTLFTPEAGQNVYLIDNCGNVVNQWLFSETPGLTCYILENGNLLRAGKDSLEIRDWDNNLVWSYDLSGNGLKQHHDIEPLPNGNILCLLTDTFSNEFMVEQGRNPTLLTDVRFKLDRIVEIEPLGMGEAQVVWEWRIIDHLIQEFDNTKANYGVVSDHPGRFNINFDNNHALDWSHCNAIDFHTERNQILITSRHLGELFIIDHSTSTAEAAGHSGGNSGVGGDLLWRWGNPQVYDQGISTDQKLFRPHDGKWVNQGYLDEDKVSVFNNGGSISTSYSAVHLIDLAYDNDIYSITNDRFDPIDFNWSWNGDILGELMFEGRKCGMQSQQNGNLLICETSKGRISEITKTGNLIWSYRNPVGLTVLNQFEQELENLDIFRGERYPESFAGFIGKDLTATEPIENVNSNSVACANITLIPEGLSKSDHLSGFYKNGYIVLDRPIEAALVEVHDLKGNLVVSSSSFNGSTFKLDATSGLYLVSIIDNVQPHNTFKIWVH